MAAGSYAGFSSLSRYRLCSKPAPSEIVFVFLKQCKIIYFCLRSLENYKLDDTAHSVNVILAVS
jgi:hypothetical protein